MSPSLLAVILAAMLVSGVRADDQASAPEYATAASIPGGTVTDYVPLPAAHPGDK